MLDSWWSVNDKGESFERWVQTVLITYGRKLNVMEVLSTGHTETYDLKFVLNNTTYLIECKCFHIWHSAKKKDWGEMSFQRGQIEDLKELADADENNEVIFVCGITFNDFDMYTVMLTLDELLPLYRKTNANQVTVTMKKLIGMKPFREWLSDTFQVPCNGIRFPTFIIEKCEPQKILITGRQNP